MAKKNKTLAGISLRNKKEIEQLKPTPRSISDAYSEESTSKAATLIINKLKGDESDLEPKEDVEEKEIESPLPNIEVPVSADDVKKALYGLLNLFDTLYFVVIKNTNICSKKVEVERNCLLECQHYGYCKVRGSIRETIKKI